MKKLTFLFFIFLLTSATTQAQFGVKSGASLSASGSYGNSENGESVDMKFGFQGGAFYKHNISETFDLMVELNYEARGTVSKKDYTFKAPVEVGGTILGIGDFDVNQEINSVQSYFNIPILAVFGGEKFKYYAGPNIGFLISGKADFERTVDVSLNENMIASSKSSEDGIDWKDYDSFKVIFTDPPPAEDGNFLNDFEFGINVGAMYYVTENLFIDLRVSQGLTDVTNNHYDNSIYPDQSYSFSSRDDVDRNFSIQLGGGYSF